jgi:hypothetical protein
MARYNPPTKVATIQIPFLALITQVDPDWNRFKHWDVVYQFTRRDFYEDPYVSGPYNPVQDNPIIPLAGALATESGDILLTDSGLQILIEP